MDNFNNINAALEYVENRLDEDIQMASVAKIVGCSLYNFQRMFSFLTNTSFSEYIRNRRLTLAAVDLQQGGVQVNDVACKYGYTSPTAFTRAFTAFHGITPKAAKQENSLLKVYPRITFSLSIKGGQALDYRIETLEAFTVEGIEIVAPLNENGFKAPAKLWKTCFENGKIEELQATSSTPPLPVKPSAQALYGIANYRDTGEGNFPYMVCHATKNTHANSKFTTATIPTQTYAVLKSQTYPAGNLALAQKSAVEVQQQFYREWLPTVNYKKTNGAELEIYYEKSSTAFLEIWYPVQKKRT